MVDEAKNEMDLAATNIEDGVFPKSSMSIPELNNYVGLFIIALVYLGLCALPNFI
jgi:hypothetical protein